MCGIAGFTQQDAGATDARSIISAMLSSISHRGPDDCDSLIRDDLVLGHNRLTVMEPAGGQQPRVHAESGNVLIFNGEIYHHRRFDAELVAAGAKLRDHCDTETLFWLLQIHGIDKTLSMVDGMFAFAWYEAADDTLHLARDRFGQKPLFFSDTSQGLVFASEIKALRQHPALSQLRPDPIALSLYLMMEYVPGPATGLDKVFEVPAGFVLKWRRRIVSIEPYWRALDVQVCPTIDAAAAATGLDERLHNAVQQQLIADVPVGVFLSGGIDSSLLAAIATRHSDDVATFTVKFPYASFDESTHAAAVAEHLGTRHTTVELDRQNCIDGIEFLLQHTDQPFSDSSMLPSYLLCRATKPHVTVALGGDGADELLLGYPNFRLHRIAPVLAVLPGALGGLMRAVAKRLPDSTDYMNRAFLLRQLSYGLGKPPDQQSVYWMSAIAPFEQSRLWLGEHDHDAAIENALYAQFVQAKELPLMQRWQHQFITAYLANGILQKMDRASMLNSLEVRSPYLSNAVAEFALSLPTRTLFQRGEGKRVLKRVAAAYLPDATIRRRKHGFGLPVSALLRGDLRELAESYLQDGANPMYECLDKDWVVSRLNEHMAATRDHGKALWALMMLAAFMRNQISLSR